MTLLRMDNILLVVEDLDGAIAFFTALGMELEGRTVLEGSHVDRIVNLQDVRSEIAMMRAPDGTGRIELDKFHAPPAVTSEPRDAPVNTLGYRRVMFAVENLTEVVARMEASGAELLGEVTEIEEPPYMMCYLRGPEGIIVGLAEELS